MVAAILSCLMLSALPMDAFVLKGQREDHIALALLATVAVTCIWAFVALGRGRRAGLLLTWGLAAYAAVMLGSKAIAFGGLPPLQRSSVMIGGLVVSGVMFLALIVAGLACLPRGRAGKADPLAPAV